MTENMRNFLETGLDNNDEMFFEVLSKGRAKIIGYAADKGMTLTKEDVDSMCDEMSDANLDAASGGSEFGYLEPIIPLPWETPDDFYARRRQYLKDFYHNYHKHLQ